MDNKIGSVEVGKYADPGILDRNSLEMDFEEIADIKARVIVENLNRSVIGDQ